MLSHIDADTGRPFVDVVRDAAEQKGTGRWTVQTALDLGVPVTGIAEATMARAVSGDTARRAAVREALAGEGPAARTVRIDLPPFTLVGATTRAGLLATPLRDRFGIPLRLQFYSAEELERIVARGAGKLGFELTPDGAREIATRSRGTPRIAGRLLRRVRDFAAVAGRPADPPRPAALGGGHGAPSSPSRPMPVSTIASNRGP